MFVDITFGHTMRSVGTQPIIGVPRDGGAGDRRENKVVYLLTNQSGVFAQREVTPGSDASGLTAIYAGLDARRLRRVPEFAWCNRTIFQRRLRSLLRERA